MQDKQDMVMKQNKKSCWTRCKNINFFSFFVKQESIFSILLALFLFIGFLLFIDRFPLRLDLTKDKIYTLSETSKKLVSNLKDPLRISVFISRELPPPFNNIEVAVRDLLYEYSQSANENFSYVIYDVTSGRNGAENTSEVEENQKLAASYGVLPTNVQIVDKDQVKVVSAYMAMVIEYADMVEFIHTLNDKVSLEYQVSFLMAKMNSRINKLLALKDGEIKASLYLPKDFISVAPFFDVSGLSKDIFKEINGQIEKANQKNYGKISFEEKNEPLQGDFLEQKGIKYFAWNAFSDKKVRYPDGIGAAALELTLGDRSIVVELLQEKVSLRFLNSKIQQVPTYTLIEFDALNEKIDSVIDNLLGVNQKISYLKLKQGGTLELSRDEKNPNGMYGAQRNSYPPEGDNFSKLIKPRYQMDEVYLDDAIDNRYKTLIVAGLSQKLTDYQLYLIDQFLMKGGSLYIFHDMYRYARTENMGMGMSYPEFVLKEPTGLEDLMEHYGVRFKPEMVMDEESYVSRSRDAKGSVKEEKLYYIPFIKNANINKEFLPLNKIKSLIWFLGSPLEVVDNISNQKDVSAISLFSSSKNSWVEDGEQIALFNYFLKKPKEKNKYAPRKLGYLLEGFFDSYFKGKEIPENLEQIDEKKNIAKKAVPTHVVSRVFNDNVANSFVSRSKKMGRIVVLGSSMVLKNNMIEPEAVDNPNIIFLLNLLDYCNGQNDWISMRSKTQRVAAVESYDEKNGLLNFFMTNRRIVKFINIVFWPMLVIICGIVFWLDRKKFRKSIENNKN